MMVSKEVVLNDIFYEYGLPTFNERYGPYGTIILPRKRITTIPLNVLESIIDAMPESKQPAPSFDEILSMFE